MTRNPAERTYPHDHIALRAPRTVDVSARAACAASLRAARLIGQTPDDYAPASQVGLLLERYPSAAVALEAAKFVARSLTPPEFDHFVWIGHAREHAKCVERHLVEIVQEEARSEHVTEESD